MAKVGMSMAKKGAIGLGAINGGMMYFSRRSEHPEESKMTSLGYAAAETAFYAFMPGLAFARDAGQIAAQIGQSGAFNRDMARMKKANRYMQGASWNYTDTEQAATMRQRGLQAIQNSKLNARSALGGEARSLQRGALY